VVSLESSYIELAVLSILMFSSLLSVWTVYRSGMSLLGKVALALLALTPLIGPLLVAYLFFPEERKRHPTRLPLLHEKDSGCRGVWTHHWITTRPLVEDFINRRRKAVTVDAEDSSSEFQESSENDSSIPPRSSH